MKLKSTNKTLETLRKHTLPASRDLNRSDLRLLIQDFEEAIKKWEEEEGIKVQREEFPPELLEE
jgi:hypothetical protein